MFSLVPIDKSVCQLHCSWILYLSDQALILSIVIIRKVWAWNRLYKKYEKMVTKLSRNSMKYEETVDSWLISKFSGCYDHNHILYVCVCVCLQSELLYNTIYEKTVMNGITINWRVNLKCCSPPYVGLVRGDFNMRVTLISHFERESGLSEEKWVFWENEQSIK